MSHNVCKCYLLRLSKGEYVGITQMTILRRLSFHRRAASFVGKALRKYGSPEILILGFGTREEMKQQERQEISARKPRYNLSAGGDGFSGDEMRAYWQDPIFRKVATAKMRKKHLNLLDEDRARCIARLVNYNKSEAGRKLQSEKMKKYWSVPANRKAHGEKIKKHASA